MPGIDSRAFAFISGSLRILRRTSREMRLSGLSPPEETVAGRCVPPRERRHPLASDERPWSRAVLPNVSLPLLPAPNSPTNLTPTPFSPVFVHFRAFDLSCFRDSTLVLALCRFALRRVRYRQTLQSRCATNPPGSHEPTAERSAGKGQEIDQHQCPGGDILGTINPDD